MEEQLQKLREAPMMPLFKEFLEEQNLYEQYIHRLGSSGKDPDFIDRMNAEPYSYISSAFVWDFRDDGIDWSRIHSLWSVRLGDAHRASVNPDMYKLPPILDGFLRENGARESFIVEAVARKLSSNVEIGPDCLLKCSGGSAIDQALIWSLTLQGSDYWGDLDMKFKNYFSSIGIKRYRVTLKPSLDKFLRRLGLRKEYISLMKSHATKTRSDIGYIESIVNASNGANCICIVIEYGTAQATGSLTWGDIAQMFNKQDTDSLSYLISKYQPE